MSNPIDRCVFCGAAINVDNMCRWCANLSRRASYRAALQKIQAAHPTWQGAKLRRAWYKAVMGLPLQGRCVSHEVPPP